MILTCLLILVSQPAQEDAISARYRKFMAAHPVLSVDVAISGVRSGKGVITLRRRKNAPPKVDWTATIAGGPIRFISDGNYGLDIDVTNTAYDRLPISAGSFPGGRLVNTFGFPYAIVAGDTPFDQIKPETVTSRKGDLFELKATQKTSIGIQVITADFASDGHLTHYSIEKGQEGRLAGQMLDFSNYRFGSASVASTFSVKPPRGYNPLAFDFPITPISIGGEFKRIRLLGRNSIDPVPDGLIAFVDSPCPPGLADCLLLINKTVPVSIIEMKGTNLKFGSLPVSVSDSAGFDAAQVGVTPQFYLVKKGHIVQTWQGFRADVADTFEHEISDALSGS